MSDGKLVVEYKNQRPVELVDLTRSLLALADEYEQFADEELDGAYRTETKLYIHQIQTGSIITELVPYAAGLLPILSEANTVLSFAERLQKIIDRLRKPKQEENEPDVDPRSLENVSTILEPVAKDSASQINISTKTDFHAPVIININSHDANAMQNHARRLLEAQKAPDKGRHEKVLMYLHQARNDLQSKAGDRGIIESISKKDVKVVFLSDATKAQMLRADENPFRYAFVVDVDVETVKGKPALYRILACHEHVEKPA